MTEKPIVVDIWGGEDSSDYLARFILPMDQALQVAKQELLGGFLVNMRSDIVFGIEHNFDNRSKGAN